VPNDRHGGRCDGLLAPAPHAVGVSPRVPGYRDASDDHLIRGNGRTVQNRPVLVTCWADVPVLSSPVDSWLQPWQQCWQQLDRPPAIVVISLDRGCARRGHAPGAPWLRPLGLSAWEVCGVARVLPADSVTCGDLAGLSLSDRDWPRVLLLSGTQRARLLAGSLADTLRGAYWAYALRGCSRALLAGSRPAFPSGSASAAGGDCWLLMAVRGHLGDTPWPPRPAKGTCPDLPLIRKSDS
jgi:hypothetical protein